MSHPSPDTNSPDTGSAVTRSQSEGSPGADMHARKPATQRNRVSSLATQRQQLLAKQARLADRIAALDKREQTMRERGIDTALKQYSAVLRRLCVGADLHFAMKPGDLEAVVTEWLRGRKR